MGDGSTGQTVHYSGTPGATNTHLTTASVTEERTPNSQSLRSVGKKTLDGSRGDWQRGQTVYSSGAPGTTNTLLTTEAASERR